MPPKFRNLLAAFLTLVLPKTTKSLTLRAIAADSRLRLAMAEIENLRRREIVLERAINAQGRIIQEQERRILELAPPPHVS